MMPTLAMRLTLTTATLRSEANELPCYAPCAMLMHATPVQFAADEAVPHHCASSEVVNRCRRSAIYKHGAQLPFPAQRQTGHCRAAPSASASAKHNAPNRTSGAGRRYWLYARRVTPVIAR
eukprot:6201199-Pleurochrysis_carterae.AAC.2